MKSEITVLNKFLAQAGICSRRKAIDEIKAGHVKVNSIIITDPAYKVLPKDSVLYKEDLIKSEEKIYILLHKPEGFVTTVSDDLKRPTVLNLINNRQLNKKRLYPVGRLDLTTSGLLIITNDGDLAQILAHPKFEVSKTYRVSLDQDLEFEDLHRIKKGLRLEDGFINVDKIYHVKLPSRKKLVVEIHSGKNRIIRRIFKALGYNVTKLERIGYAGLTSKGVPLGGWRLLNKSEIAELKNLAD